MARGLLIQDVDQTWAMGYGSDGGSSNQAWLAFVDVDRDHGHIVNLGDIHL